jgi:hypothetical protein
MSSDIKSSLDLWPDDLNKFQNQETKLCTNYTVYLSNILNSHRVIELFTIPKCP